jgi:hypothetical protein
MDPRPPVVQPAPADWDTRRSIRVLNDPGFGPFDCDAIRAENNRRAAGAAFSCVAAQIAIILAACLAMGVAFMIGWHQMIIYEAQLAACAGV